MKCALLCHVFGPRSGKKIICSYSLSLTKVTLINHNVCMRHFSLVFRNGELLCITINVINVFVSLCTMLETMKTNRGNYLEMFGGVLSGVSVCNFFIGF